MEKYRCCLKCDYDDGADTEWVEVKGFEPSDAAEGYADENKVITEMDINEIIFYLVTDYIKDKVAKRLKNMGYKIKD